MEGTGTGRGNISIQLRFANFPRLSPINSPAVHTGLEGVRIEGIRRVREGMKGGRGERTRGGKSLDTGLGRNQVLQFIKRCRETVCPISISRG